MQTFKVLYGYKGKIAGIIISIFGLLLMLIDKIFPTFTIINKWSLDQHFQLFLWIAFLGFYMIAFSKEKNDDERVRVIRGKSMTIAFSMIISLVLAITLVGILDPKMTLSVGNDMFLFPAFGLSVYLLHFNIGLYSNDVWNYAADDTLLGSLRKNKLYLIIYIAIGLGLLFLLRFL